MFLHWTSRRHPSSLSRQVLVSLVLLLSAPPLCLAYNLDLNSTSSAKLISKQLAEDMLSFYQGDQPGQTPGLPNMPYYWWYGGAMLGTLIDYWYYTGDTTYNKLTTDGLLFQVGKNNDYMPYNQTRTEGNDDQGFWGLAAMSAAETNFPNPPADQPQWLALAQAVFNTQAARWDSANCGGGLRWQIFTWNNGYDYKNSISQACFFALGARLALYTGNQTYADWAERTWDWMIHSGLMNQQSWYVFDGVSIASNCSKMVPYQWTYNAGGFILGAAALYNYTGEAIWLQRLNNLLDGASVFFTGPNHNIMSEVACEPVDLCDLDQESFKGYLSRWLAAITKWVPDTYDRVMPLLHASAVAAAAQCTGGDNGRMCGIKWNTGKWDGTSGLGQQLSVLEVVLATTIKHSSPLLTNQTGGTSVGDPNAGAGDIGSAHSRMLPSSPLLDDPADRAGAAILTILLLTLFLFTIFFLFDDECSEKTYGEKWADFKSSLVAFTARDGTLHMFGRHCGRLVPLLLGRLEGRPAMPDRTFPSMSDQESSAGFHSVSSVDVMSRRASAVSVVSSASFLTSVSSIIASRPISGSSAASDNSLREAKSTSSRENSILRKPLPPPPPDASPVLHPQRLALRASPRRLVSIRHSATPEVSVERLNTFQAWRETRRASVPYPNHQQPNLE